MTLVRVRTWTSYSANTKSMSFDGLAFVTGNTGEPLGRGSVVRWSAECRMRWEVECSVCVTRRGRSGSRE